LDLSNDLLPPTAKVLETTRDHWLGDQTALEALIRFSDEELKHQ